MDQLLRALLSSPSTVLVAADRAGVISAWSEGAAALYGWTAEEAIGQPLSVLAPPERVAEQDARLRLYAGQPLPTFETVRLHKDGTAIPVELHVVPVRDDAGCVVGTASLHRDQRRASTAESALEATQDELRAQAARYESVLDSMPVIVFTYDADGVCTSSRGSALTQLGLDQDEVVGRRLQVHYADDPVGVAALEESLAGRPSRSTFEAGGRMWLAHYRPVLSPDGAVMGGIGISVDVSAQAAAEREVATHEARIASLLRYAHDVAIVVDLDGRIVFASAAARNRLGYDESELFWRDARSFNHPDDRPVVSAAWQAALADPGASAHFECRVLHADGTWRWADHVLTNLVADPAVGGMVVNITESTERRAGQDELRRLAVRDALTGLANRTLLLDRVERALVLGRRTGAATGLVLLDVDGMAAVNDAVGHVGGDAVLRVLAARLETALRPTDTVARVGGDAFAVLAEDLASEEDLRSRAAALVAVLDEPVQVEDRVLRVRLQVGTALGPAPDAGALLSAAERAAQVNREPSRVVVVAAASARESEVDALRRAVLEGELVLHYQPLVDVGTGRAVGAEALVRWQHPDRGLLLPGEFIPLAESSGLVVDLGAWALREAVAQLVRWQDRSLTLAINVSGRQLVDHAFPQLLAALLAASGLPGERLVVEVTESTLMDEPAAAVVLRAVRDLGVHLALDDFGTGYSSLTYLKRFPVDTVKVDRSFVAGLGRDADDEAIVASVVSLARAVGKQVVAEGVETLQQLEVLRSLGVDLAQGFLWAPALPIGELEPWLAAIGTAPAPARRPAPIAVARTTGGDEARILSLHRQGASLHTMAAALNAEGRRTPSGPRWTTKTVARIVASFGPPAPVVVT